MTTSRRILVAAAGATVLATLFYYRRQRLARGKPQRRFRRVLADNSDTPFQHSVPPDALPDSSGRAGAPSAPLHPYSHRIQDLIQQCDERPTLPEVQSAVAPLCGEGQEPPAGQGRLRHDTYHFVQSLQQLRRLIAELRLETEIAVDVEHHREHSYRGFVCLVQIATRRADYVIDAVALHDQLHLLAPLFADPAVLKVFHACSNDVRWLQRDFHIYPVNVFDTQAAVECLQRPERSLADLLRAAFGVTKDRRLAASDWRVRPLPEALLQYARGDVHHLLPLKDVLAAALAVAGGPPLLRRACACSHRASLQVYEKPAVGAPEAAARAVLKRHRGEVWSLCRGRQGWRSTAEQQQVAASLVRWREEAARRRDESPAAVLPDRLVAALALCRPCLPHHVHSIISQSEAAADLLAALASRRPLPQTAWHRARWLEARARALVDDTWHTAQQVAGLLSAPQQRAGAAAEEEPSEAPEGHAAPPHAATTPTLAPSDRPKDAGGRRARVGEAEARAQRVAKFSCKAPVYDSCRIYAPHDGRLLAYCDRKKLEWYVKRGIADVVSEDPPSIRLRFEPKDKLKRNRPVGGDTGHSEFELDFHEENVKAGGRLNQCVACGEASHYLRFRIIPTCYRRYFPVALKSHRSHDVVLLCIDCHEVAQKASERVKRAIAEEYRVPLHWVWGHAPDAPASSAPPAPSGEADADSTAGAAAPHPHPHPGAQAVQRAAKILKDQRHLPEWRREQLLDVLRAHYGRPDLGPEDVHSAALLGVGKQTLRRYKRKAKAKREGVGDGGSREAEGCAEAADAAGGAQPAGDAWADSQVHTAPSRGGPLAPLPPSSP